MAKGDYANSFGFASAALNRCSVVFGDRCYAGGVAKYEDGAWTVLSQGEG